jgi:hypothetical protein
VVAHWSRRGAAHSKGGVVAHVAMVVAQWSRRCSSFDQA